MPVGRIFTMEIKGVTLPAWELTDHPSLFILSASPLLCRVVGKFPGFSAHSLLVCEVAENRLLMDGRAHLRELHIS